MNLLIAGVLGLLLGGCGGGPQADTTLVLSSDPELRRVAAELLPDLAGRAGLNLREPVRVERRSRDQLQSYLEAKLDEELPPARARGLTRSYALLGLVPGDLDLRSLLLAVYREQVAGFYDPDSTALFVLDDQPPELLRGVLVHELVHAVQDQTANLDSLTDAARGNDPQTAAQAAIEGHATLVMLEHVLATQGQEIDLAGLPDFAARLRPALEAIGGQYPELANAPRIVRESMLFPYVEGAGFVQALWAATGRRVPPFDDDLPHSTEQVLAPDRFLAARDEPTRVVLTVGGEAPPGYSDGLGELETRILLEELVDEAAGSAASGWDGDRYVLLGGGAGLAWASVWDDVAARDRFVRTLRPALGRLGRPASLEALEVQGRPAALLEVGEVGEAPVIRLEGGEDGGRP